MIILFISLGVILLLAIFVIVNYNSLVVLRNKVRTQFAQIDVQLQKRADLIPNIVEVVKAYAKHEKETLEVVIKARNTYLSSDSIDDKLDANTKISSALTKLLAVAEGYPELKANTNFLDLQKQLTEVEEKISYARQFFNDSVLFYNNKCEVIPSNIIAKLFHFEKGKFFEADDRQSVKVEF